MGNLCSYDPESEPDETEENLVRFSSSEEITGSCIYSTNVVSTKTIPDFEVVRIEKVKKRFKLYYDKLSTEKVNIHSWHNYNLYYGHFDTCPYYLFLDKQNNGFLVYGTIIKNVMSQISE